MSSSSSETPEGGEHLERKGLPSMASEAYRQNLPEAARLDQMDDPSASPRTSASFFRRLLQLQLGQDPTLPTIGARLEKQYNGFFDYWFSPMTPLRPKDYVDAYTRRNPCPEEYWWASWRWPRTKYVNAKVPPPENGEYQDFYHYLAFKLWLERERDVYVAQANLTHEMLNRCIVKEGQYNAAKNCRHLYNKAFAMSRMEELNQALLYMAMTGNNAIRETPYPENFVEEKRKIYDDWLHRTRLRKPGDAA